MSTIKDILERVDRNKPNAFSDERKIRWIAELDGKIALQVFLMSYADASHLQYKYPQDLDKKPLVGFPHEDLYDSWLESKIDLQNGETDKYQNSKVVFDSLYNDYLNWICNTYAPGQGNSDDVIGNMSVIPTYYITAYGLAVRQGFTGTLNEWLASLKGEKGDKGDPGARIRIGTVTTLPAGSSANATMSGTLEDPVLNLGIPEGTDNGLPVTGGDMKGPIAMGGFRIFGLPLPAESGDPVTLGLLNSMFTICNSVGEIDPDNPKTNSGFYEVTQDYPIYGVKEGVLWHLNLGFYVWQFLISADASVIWFRSFKDGWSPRRQLGFMYGTEEEYPADPQEGQLFFVKQ